MKKIWITVLGLLTMVLGSFGSISHAAEMPDTTNLILHKLQYVGPNQDGTIINDGLQKPGIPNGFESYNPEENGDVEFTLVDVTDYVNIEGPDSVEEEIIMLSPTDYETWITENGTIVERKNVGTDGRVNFNNVNSTVTENGEFRYYVVFETKTPERVKNPAQPILVQLPMTNQEGTDYLTDVYIYPKNQLNDDDPTVEKNVVDEDGNIITGKPSFSIGDKVNYSVVIDIPRDISEYVVFGYADEGQKGLTYTGTPEPKLYGTAADGEEVELVAGTDYTYTKSGNGFTVDFITANGSVSPNVSKVAGGTIYVDYQMTINEEAVVGESIDNSYVLEWQNSPSAPKKEETGKTPVYTGGAKFIKEDAQTGATLSGAEFVVKNGSNQYYSLNASGEVVWVLDEKDAMKLTSDTNGAFEVTGLANGKYYLVETKAPDGYALSNKPIEFEITDNSYTSESIKVKNYKKTLLPATGSTQLIIMFGVGLSLLGISVVYYRKRKA